MCFPDELDVAQPMVYDMSSFILSPVNFSILCWWKRRMLQAIKSQFPAEIVPSSYVYMVW